MGLAYIYSHEWLIFMVSISRQIYKRPMRIPSWVISKQRKSGEEATKRTSLVLQIACEKAFRSQKKKHSKTSCRRNWSKTTSEKTLLALDLFKVIFFFTDEFYHGKSASNRDYFFQASNGQGQNPLDPKNPMGKKKQKKSQMSSNKDPVI